MNIAMRRPMTVEQFLASVRCCARLPELGIDIPLAEFYADVPLAAEPEAAADG